MTENEQDIVAESEMLELVKEDALKESNVEDKDNKQNDGTQLDTNDNSVAGDINSDNANTASDKSSEDKTAAGQKTSTDSNKTSTGSNNTQKLPVTIRNRKHQIRQLHLSRLKVSPRSRKHLKMSMLHRDGYFMAVRPEMA